VNFFARGLRVLWIFSLWANWPVYGRNLEVLYDASHVVSAIWSSHVAAALCGAWPSPFTSQRRTAVSVHIYSARTNTLIRECDARAVCVVSVCERDASNMWTNLDEIVLHRSRVHDFDEVMKFRTPPIIPIRLERPKLAR